MLPAAHRLRRPDQFRTVLRGRRDGVRLVGTRAGGDLLVVHLVRLPSDPADPSAPARVGFVVSKAVGNAVVRNRTQRRLRHLMAERLERVPDRADLVIRALPSAATADSTALGRELDQLVDGALRRTAVSA